MLGLCEVLHQSAYRSLPAIAGNSNVDCSSTDCSCSWHMRLELHNTLLVPLGTDSRNTADSMLDDTIAHNHTQEGTARQAGRVDTLEEPMPQ